ncbi:MAG: GIY-YIG nuclease family protein [Myxococcota bacterium]|nr:GIY-YIG nuclease family protein [Myxococcota bacterium]MEC8424810.1 GIY-YIG nuclease family protein [Myxococcota bacterium]
MSDRKAPADTGRRWTVYVLRSTVRARTYVGITIDLERRLAEHNGERPGGASSTRAGRPWAIARTYGPYETRSEASRVECQVKALRGSRRLCWRPAGSDPDRA